MYTHELSTIYFQKNIVEVNFIKYYEIQFWPRITKIEVVGS